KNCKQNKGRRLISYLKTTRNSAIFVAFHLRWYLIGRSYRSKRRLRGKVVIVTGGNSGIGFEVCKELSGKYEATVILACRNSDFGRIAVAKIQREYPGADIRFEQLDLCSFLSVCTFVKKITQNYREIYAIVNNAGIFYHGPLLTKDGFEITFQTNYLAPFLLTTNLLPALNGRIVNVASQAQEYVTEFPQADYHLAYPDSSVARFESYFYSKFCLVLWSVKLATLLSQAETPKKHISVHCVDPGNVETNIFRNFPPLATPFWFYLQKPIRFWCIKTPWEGAQSILFALLEPPSAVPFYVKHQRAAEYNPLCDNQKYQDQLWHISQKNLEKWIN
ncbi:dehydrogenase/reductase SDR family member on chromosome X-like, partial [Culicoides brevitarsis]|uniref:dehydrogenase/reductase SDR family member on chromosome X-like n=1 Tax=Culicoides brevitarsis TaxID=469753 RepID=UPI00307C1579